MRTVSFLYSLKLLNNIRKKYCIIRTQSCATCFGFLGIATFLNSDHFYLSSFQNQDFWPNTSVSLAVFKQDFSLFPFSLSEMGFVGWLSDLALCTSFLVSPKKPWCKPDCHSSLWVRLTKKKKREIWVFLRIQGYLSTVQLKCFTWLDLAPLAGVQSMTNQLGTFIYVT